MDGTREGRDRRGFQTRLKDIRAFVFYLWCALVLFGAVLVWKYLSQYRLHSKILLHAILSPGYLFALGAVSLAVAVSLVLILVVPSLVMVTGLEQNQEVNSTDSTKLREIRQDRWFKLALTALFAFPGVLSYCFLKHGGLGSGFSWTFLAYLVLASFVFICFCVSRSLVPWSLSLFSLFLSSLISQFLIMLPIALSVRILSLFVNSLVLLPVASIVWAVLNCAIVLKFSRINEALKWAIFGVVLLSCLIVWDPSFTGRVVRVAGIGGYEALFYVDWAPKPLRCEVILELPDVYLLRRVAADESNSSTSSSRLSSGEAWRGKEKPRSCKQKGDESAALILFKNDIRMLVVNGKE